MAKIYKSASTDKMMVLDLTYQGKRYRFNMFEELQIKEINLDKDIKSHPASYFFLLTLRTNLDSQRKLLEAKKKRIWNKIYKLEKNKPGVGGRAQSDDLCKAKAEAHPDYKEVTTEHIESEKAWGIINNAVLAFQEKKDLIQTLSANMRKER